jgi:predicted AAA+ superfamily ATPase
LAARRIEIVKFISQNKILSEIFKRSFSSLREHPTYLFLKRKNKWTLLSYLELRFPI